MSRICELTGKKPQSGHNVSHAKNRTKRRWLPNLQTKVYEVPTLKKSVKVTLSTRAMRTIAKLGGLSAALLKAKDDKLSPTLLKVKRNIQK